MSAAVLLIVASEYREFLQLPPVEVCHIPISCNLFHSSIFCFELPTDGRGMERINAASTTMTGPASLSKELQNQLNERYRSARVPAVNRKIIDAMAREISSFRAESDRLNHEVAAD